MLLMSGLLIGDHWPVDAETRAAEQRVSLFASEQKEAKPVIKSIKKQRRRQGEHKMKKRKDRKKVVRFIMKKKALTTIIRERQRQLMNSGTPVTRATRPNEKEVEG